RIDAIAKVDGAGTLVRISARAPTADGHRAQGYHTSRTPGRTVSVREAGTADVPGKNADLRKGPPPTSQTRCGPGPRHAASRRPARARRPASTKLLGKLAAGGRGGYDVMVSWVVRSNPAAQPVRCPGPSPIRSRGRTSQCSSPASR